MGKSPSRQVISLPSLVAIGSGSRDIIILICHVILQDHVIKGSDDFGAGVH